jgi:hypothetical protein
VAQVSTQSPLAILEFMKHKWRVIMMLFWVLSPSSGRNLETICFSEKLLHSYESVALVV